MTVAAIATPPSSLPPLELHTLDDRELDLLPFGVIALDHEGTIVRYNRVEARFARLDRALVLGKSFFRTVAPCAATPEFEGRFRAFVAAPDGPRRIRFEYVFNFRFGAQEVDVDLVRTPAHVYVCVGRRSFRAEPKRDVPGGHLDGIALSELAPDESQQGVVRDAERRRNLVLDASFLDGLHAAARSAAAPNLLEEIGIAYGRRLALDLEAEAAESFSSGLADLPIVTVVEMLAQVLRRQGWGALAADFGTARDGVMRVTLARSAVAEAGGTLGARRCALVAGILRAVLSHVAARGLVVREEHCIAEGASECAFAAAAADHDDDDAGSGRSDPRQWPAARFFELLR